MADYSLVRKLNWDGDVLHVHDAVREISSNIEFQTEDFILKHFDADMSDFREYMHDKIAWERKQEPKWIPINKLLPSHDEDVLAWIEDEKESRITAANYYHDIWYDCIMNCEEKRIKYWMPLPRPPKGEENA